MKRFLSLIPPAALFLSAASFLTAQSISPAISPPANPPIDSSVTQPAAQSAPAPPPTVQSVPAGVLQAESVYGPQDKLEYFSLEHRAPGQLDPADAELLKKRQRDVLAEAEFYGYDMSSGSRSGANAQSSSWTYEQSVCPQMPDYVMLRYTSSAAGADSIFTVLVPRNSGRVRIVPVLNHGATRFRPAANDPRNYQLFAQIIPADAARQASGPEGKWLMLSVCYAEMTGAQPQVPNQPELEPRMITAPPPSLRVFVAGKEREVRFVDPISEKDYRLWDITYNDEGRIIRAGYDEHSFTTPVVQHPAEPVAREMPPPPDPLHRQAPEPSTTSTSGNQSPQP